MNKLHEALFRWRYTRQSIDEEYLQLPTSVNPTSITVSNNSDSATTPLNPTLNSCPLSSPSYRKSRSGHIIAAMHFFTLALLCFILVGVHYSDAFYSEDYGVQLSNCPSECDCQGLNIDCSKRALTEVPKPLPEECRRL